jgi:Bifunctional DNA primase/polymerase, N-terminal
MDKPDILEAARGYAGLGLPIIPLSGKVPAIKGWQQFVANEVNLRLYFGDQGCNVGLRTGESGYLVVDTDTDEAEEWVKTHLPESPMRARSGSGSLHSYFEAPPKKEVRNKQGWKGIQGLDVRGHGGYIVLAPSIHPETGKRYEWVTGLVPPEELPRFSPAWIYQRTRRKVQTVVLANDADFMELRASRWLEKVEGAVSGKGGHNATFRVACKLTHYFGLGEEAAVRLMLAVFNPKCEPEWSEGEIRHKVADALKKVHQK